MDCLRRFVREGSDDAFAQVVRRRINLVYSAALRQVNDAAMAEDISQVVFIALARKAAGIIDRDVVVSAWLLRTTRLTALDALRRRRRRIRHEQRAAIMKANETDPPTDEQAWDDVRPLLDKAILSLREMDRRAIVLRFFEGRSIREVGAMLGTSEEAARQRLWRAVERLRTKLGARGVMCSPAVLAGVLGSHAIVAAPAQLADAATRAALTAAGAKATIPLGLKGALQLMAWTKAQAAGAVVVAALILGGTTATVMYVNHSGDQSVAIAPGVPTPSLKSQAPQARGTVPISADAKSRFDQAYALAPGQFMKHVALPFIPERAAYLRSIDDQHMFDVNATNELYSFSWDGHTAGLVRWSAAKCTVGQMIHDLMGVPTYKLEMASELSHRSVAGDWVFRPGASVEEQFADLSRILEAEQQLRVRFEKREGLRPVLVAKGQLGFKSLNPQQSHGKEALIHFYLGKPPRQINGMGTGDVRAMFQAIGESLGREVIDETGEGSGPTTQPKYWYMWSNHLSGGLTEEQISQAAKNIGDQLEVTFMPDQRNVSYWSAVISLDAASTQ